MIGGTSLFVWPSLIGTEKPSQAVPCCCTPSQSGCAMRDKPLSESPACTPARFPPPRRFGPSPSSFVAWLNRGAVGAAVSMAGNPLASLPGVPQRPSLARSSASETRLTQPGIEAARSRKLNSAPTAAFRIKYEEVHLKAYADGRKARTGIGRWIDFY